MMDWALRLLRLLNERKVITSAVVREEFGVSLRTAQRYLVYLSGLPCVTVDEKTHTYSLVSDYLIRDEILDTKQLALLCALLDYASHIFGPDHARFIGALKKRLFRTPDVYQLMKEAAIDADRVAAAQEALERAIKERQAVSFHYARSGKRYTVEPYRILYHAGFWYLVGRHEGLTKKWLLDFIEDLRLAAGWRFAPLSEATLKALGDAQTIWFQDRQPDRVTVAFDAEVAHFFERKSIFPGQQVVGRREDGAIVVSFDAHNEMDFRTQIASWMPHFTVLEPASYREYIARVAARASERNA